MIRRSARWITIVLAATLYTFSAYDEANAITFNYVGSTFDFYTTNNAPNPFDGLNVVALVTLNSPVTPSDGTYFFNNPLFTDASLSSGHIAVDLGYLNINTNFITISGGQIVSWNIAWNDSPYFREILLTSNGTSGATDSAYIGFPFFDYGSSDSPGTWTEVSPLPATLPLFASGLGALGLLGWREKRKAAIAS